jgi:hypothetical protein
MTIALTTRQIKDGAGNLMSIKVVDISGTGAGPFFPLQFLATADGLNVLDFAALSAAEVSAVATFAAASHADLDAILAKLPADPATGARQTALLSAIGEVQASPTANTVLDRLKAIATGLGSVVLGAGAAVIGKVIAAGPDFQASGVAAVTGALAGAANSSAFTPKAGRQAYLTLSGGTSLSGAIQWSLDGGTTWGPIDLGDGTRLGTITYSGTTITIPIPTSEQSGTQYRLAATSGSANYSFTQ